MLCCVNDCGREAHYMEKALCQKHYFRQWRYGTTDLLRTARPRIEDERGYQYLHAPIHPLLAKGQIYVAEHRILLYAAIGSSTMCCELCQMEMTWATCQVDHIDENPRNNTLSNLRPLCRRCNVWRTMPAAHVRIKRAIAISFDGVTKTPHEWSRDSRVNLSGAQIRTRKKAGMTDEQALFSPKVTHNGKKSAPKGPPKPHANIEANGLVMTPAAWARQLGVTVSDVTIRKRIKEGWKSHDAIFSTVTARTKQLKREVQC